MINKLIVIVFLFSSSIFLSFAQAKSALYFNDYFESHTLRIDYLLVGNKQNEIFVLEQIKHTKYWAGKAQIITNEKTQYGNYRFNLYDSLTQVLLYSKGFSSLIEEWEATPEADSITKSFYHVNLMPFPKNTVKYELQKRNKLNGEFETMHTTYINPTNYFILKETGMANKYSAVQKMGEAQTKVDIAFLAEGYTTNEMAKFKKDVKKLWAYFISIPPFDQYADKFNIYAIESISQESGTDVPGNSVYRNTAFNFSFYTFNIERYLTSTSLKLMHDAAEIVPYDHIFILINSDKYGGGGFYNYYSAGTSNNELSLKVAIHEFGHGFAGLADEYYSSEVAYDGYYNLQIEPWEPNITTLVNFKSKWLNMLDSATPIPTPRTEEYIDKIGVFEGGGYSAKNIYSPVQDCRMKSNVPIGFCPVCSQAIINTINYYSE